MEQYNTERPHQSIGDMPPHGRFRLAHARVLPIDDDLDGHTTQEPMPTTLPPSAGITRWVDPRGDIGIARFTYHVGREFDGERVDVVARGGLVGVVWAVRADIRERSGCFLVSQMRVLLKKEPPPVRNVGGVNDRLQSGPVEVTAKEDPGYGYDLAERLLGEANAECLRELLGDRSGRSGPQALASFRNFSTSLFAMKEVGNIKEATEIIHMDRHLAFRYIAT